MVIAPLAAAHDLGPNGLEWLLAVRIPALPADTPATLEEFLHGPMGESFAE